MDLWQLKTFLSVAKNKNFTRASEELSITQPAVSHQIKSLESQIGERVFDRGRRGVELTQAGKIFFEYATDVVSWTNELQRRIDDNRNDLVGTVCTGAATRSLEVPFTAIKNAFHKIHPDIQITYNGAHSVDELYKDVENSKIDVALTEEIPNATKFDFAPYGLFELYVVVGREHRFANKKEVSARALENEKWTLFEKNDNYRILVDEAFKNAGIAPKSIFATNDGAVIIDMISSGQYVSILRATGIQRALKEGRIIRLIAPELETVAQTYLAWRKGGASSAGSAFIEFFLEYPLPGMSPDLLDIHGSERLQRDFRTLRKAN